MPLLPYARRALLVVPAVLSLSLTLLTPAHAAGDLKIDVPGDGDGFVSGTAAPGLVFDDLMPGDLRSATIGLWNASAEPATLTMRVSDVVDGENGCVEPESNEGGDASCDVGEGELSEWLQLTVTRVDGSSVEQLWTGPFTTMTENTLLADDMPAAEQWSLRVDVLMRPEAGNVTMTDAVEFTMGWSARSTQTAPGEEPVSDDVLGDDVQVAGVAGSRTEDQALGTEGFVLPVVGATVPPWLLVYAGVLLVGGVGLLRRRRQDC